MRYIRNAREILSEKAGKKDNMYSDPKYVKMAGNTAWNGVLLALDQKFGIKHQTKKRASVDTYKNLLAKRDRTMLTLFNEAYSILHLYMGYDGSLNVNVSKGGLDLAIKIIQWCK